MLKNGLTKGLIMAVVGAGMALTGYLALNAYTPSVAESRQPPNARLPDSF